MNEKIYRVQMNSKGMPNFSTAVEVADRPQDDEFKNFDRGDLIALIEAQEERIGELLADRPQGEWIEREQEYEMFGVIVTDIDYKCTNCREYSDIEYNFCPHCGARMKGEEDD